jgi:DNA-binding transcriptional ArsR family regulator
VAERSAAARRNNDEITRSRQPSAQRARAESLDETIHQRTRLAIVSALATHDRLAFNDLKAILEITDGNLSVHARKLEEAGYVRCIKRFRGRTPLTEYALTADGRRALDAYLAHMEAIIRATREPRPG